MKKMYLGTALLAMSLLLGACTEEKKDTTEEKEISSIEKFSMGIPLDQLFEDDVPKEFAESVIDTKLKDFELEGVFSGETVKTKDFKGKPFIVKYAYTDCSACQKSQPEVEKFIKENPDVPVIQVFNENDTKESIEKFLVKTGTYENEYMVIDNPETSFAINHNANYTPAFFFVDHTGVIRFATIGSVDTTRLTAYMDLAFSKLPSDVYPRNAEKKNTEDEKSDSSNS